MRRWATSPPKQVQWDSAVNGKHRTEHNNLSQRPRHSEVDDAADIDEEEHARFEVFAACHPAPLRHCTQLGQCHCRRRVSVNLQQLVLQHQPAERHHVRSLQSRVEVLGDPANVRSQRADTDATPAAAEDTAGRLPVADEEDHRAVDGKRTLLRVSCRFRDSLDAREALGGNAP